MRRYNVWAENPEGAAENPTCIAALELERGWEKLRQCWGARGYGPDRLYCQFHARLIKQGKPVSVPKDE